MVTMRGHFCTSFRIYLSKNLLMNHWLLSSEEIYWNAKATWLGIAYWWTPLETALKYRNLYLCK